MKSGAGTFANGIEATYAALSVEVDLNAAAHVVCTGRNGNVLLRDVYADGEALGVDVWEVVFGLLRVFVCDIEADVVESVYLHLSVYGTSHNVARCKREAFVVLLHELFAIGQLQYAAVATHCLGDEVGGMRLVRVVEDSGMELHELHVLHLSLGTIDHGYAVACGNGWVRRCGIDGTCAACGHECYLTEVGVYLACIGIEDVGTVADNVGSASCDTDAQVVLSDDFHRKVIFQHFDVGVLPDGFHQPTLYLGSCVVGMMQDAELGVTAFSVKVELSVFFLVEVDAPLHEVLDALRSIAHHLFYGSGVADVVARHHGVFDVFLEVVDKKVRHRSDATLCLGCIGLFEGRLADERHLALAGICHFQGIAHACHSAAYNQEFTLLNHCLMLSLMTCFQLQMYEYHCEQQKKKHFFL